MDESVIIEREGPIAAVRMNRPARRNALSIGFMRTLTRLAAASPEAVEARERFRRR